MRARSSWLVILAISLIATAAKAQNCPNERFGTPAARITSIETAAQMLNSITSRIEAVPPSEADYIDREERAALDVGNRARFDIVFANRFYRPHQVAKADREMKASLVAAAREVRLKERVVLLSAALSKHADLVEAVNAYLERDRSLPQPVQQKSAGREISFDLVMLQAGLLRNLQCTVQLLREPS